MESLRQDLGGVLRLAAVSREALVRFEAAALSGFGVFFSWIVCLRTWGTPVHRMDRVWTV